MKCNWTIAPPQPEQSARLAQSAGISPLLAQCLLNRGLTEPGAVSQFLEPRLRQLADPFLLPNMARAVDRLLAARQAEELVVIFGDYDVDGVTATALLRENLGAMGWKLAHYLPHRFDEGYGFSPEAVKNCLEQFPARLVIAVDCGSTAVASIATLAKRGIDVVVLDHHQVSDPAPAAVALVNPQLGPDFHELCSVGLAFKLIHALIKKMRNGGAPGPGEPDLREHLDLVALGTIADLVPLRGENRILVASGLERLNTTQRPGLVALKAVAKCPEVLSGYEVGFQLGPRLNAAGRMENAEAALRLLLSRDAAEAEAIARNLDLTNRERQHVERGISQDVIASLRGRFDGERDFVIVEGREDWHIGVVGIVAARVLHEFHRPTIILGGDGSMWRGSGRSIEGFDLAAALRECGQHLHHHGGHAMAAGVTIEAGKVELFRKTLNDLARQTLKSAQLRPTLMIDAEAKLSSLTLAGVEDLRRLNPVGQGNPAVRLAVNGLSHDRPPRSMGHDNQHLKLSVTDGKHSLDAVWWNAGQSPRPEGQFDLAVTADINEYKGRRTVQLKVLDWRDSGA